MNKVVFSTSFHSKNSFFFAISFQSKVALFKFFTHMILHLYHTNIILVRTYILRSILVYIYVSPFSFQRFSFINQKVYPKEWWLIYMHAKGNYCFSLARSRRLPGNSTPTIPNTCHIVKAISPILAVVVVTAKSAEDRKSANDVGLHTWPPQPAKRAACPLLSNSTSTRGLKLHNGKNMAPNGERRVKTKYFVKNQPSIDRQDTLHHWIHEVQACKLKSERASELARSLQASKLSSKYNETQNKYRTWYT